MKDLIEKIDTALPQTQCGECDYNGCKPYAIAIAQGEATIDKCPPGGVETLIALAQLTETDAKPFIASVNNNTRQPQTAIVREAECIGCTKCIKACPVDAILGASKQMHTVITQECTGCGLCVAPCPVDCIDLVALTEPAFNKDIARQRFEARNIRLDNNNQKAKTVFKEKATNIQTHSKADYIKAALARVKAKTTKPLHE